MLLSAKTLSMWKEKSSPKKAVEKSSLKIGSTLNRLINDRINKMMRLLISRLLRVVMTEGNPLLCKVFSKCRTKILLMDSATNPAVEITLCITSLMDLRPRSIIRLGHFTIITVWLKESST